MKSKMQYKSKDTNSTIKKIFLSLSIATTLSACRIESDHSVTTHREKGQPSPIKILVSRDQTLSTLTSKIPAITLENYRVLIALINKDGGEIRDLPICDNSDQPLLSYYMPEPPAKPQQPAALPKSNEVNPLDLAKLKKQYNRDLAEYKTKLAVYNKELAMRQQEVKKKSQDFLSKLKPMLSESRSCQSTDIHGMVKRGDLFLGEAGNWRQRPSKYALLITDGLETAQPQKVPASFTSQPQIIVVSSGGQVGILKEILGDTKPYESIEGAIRFISGQVENQPQQGESQ